MHPADHPGPLAFVADVEQPTLGADDRHHLERVLRMRPGAPMTIADGRGGWRPATFGAEVEPSGEVRQVAPPSSTLTVAFALVKGDKPDLIVQKLTELGIDRMVPFRAERSVVRWDAARAAKAVARLRLVARSAAMQCHRPWLPEVEAVTDLAPLTALPGVARADRGGTPLATGHTTVLVGPEGGWTDLERSSVPTAVSLGTEVLRAETAAVAAGALMAALRAGIVRPAG